VASRLTMTSFGKARALAPCPAPFFLALQSMEKALLTVPLNSPLCRSTYFLAAVCLAEAPWLSGSSFMATPRPLFSHERGAA